MLSNNETKRKATAAAGPIPRREKIRGLAVRMTYDPRFGPGSPLLRTGKTMSVRMGNKMGNKNDIATPASARTESPASTKTTKSVPKAAGGINSPAANGDATAATTAVKKKPAKAAAKKKVTFSTEDIALRAYFISEDRQRQGIEGNEHSDWIEAERQLRKEQRKKASKQASPSNKSAPPGRARPE